MPLVWNLPCLFVCILVLSCPRAFRGGLRPRQGLGGYGNAIGGLVGELVVISRYGLCVQWLTWIWILKGLVCCLRELQLLDDHAHLVN